MAKFSVKIILLLVLVAGAFESCKKARRKADERNPHHKERPQSPGVKSVKKYGVSSRTGADTLLQVEEFDRNGYKIKLQKFSPGGGLEYEVQYTNNSDGKPVKAQTRYADGSMDIEENTYNRDGKVIATDWKRADGSSGRHEYTFDDEGNVVKWDWYEDGKFVISRLYPNTYDKDGKMQEGFYRETTNNRDTSTLQHYKYSYDDNNRLISKLSLEEGYPLALEEYIYDTLDNKIVEIFYEPDSVNEGSFVLASRQFNVYNEFGEITQYQTARGKGDIEVTVRNTYDAYGHLTETVYEYSHGFYRKERVVYEYWDKK